MCLESLPSTILIIKFWFWYWNQNSETHSNSLSAIANKLFECLWPFCGVGFKPLTNLADSMYTEAATRDVL